jgi:hypothetical protein
MKDLIRNILQEETSNEKLAKAYLSRLNLKPWKNDRYCFVFLATPKGTSIVLVIPDDHEFAVQDSTYDMLLKFLKTEDNVADFLYDYMIDLGIKLKFNKKAGWVSRSENVGGVDEDDEPYFDSNNLQEGRKPSLKNRYTNKWLEKIKLKKYKSPDGRFIYLATDSGQILVSVDNQINETAVSWSRILEPLERVLGEKTARRKVIGWLLDNFKLANMGYIYDESDDMLGKIDSEDILIEKDSIQESESKNPVKNYWFKK